MKKKKILTTTVALSLALASAPASAAKIGVHYFPGWHPVPPTENRDEHGLNQTFYSWHPFCGPDYTYQGSPRKTFRGNSVRDPWCVIKNAGGGEHFNFPERQPEIGWYNDGDVTTVQEQIKRMHRNGIDFVVFNYFWDNVNSAKPGGTPKNYQSLAAYHRIPAAERPAGFKHAILWELRDERLRPLNDTQLEQALTAVASELASPYYLRTNDGRPYLIINEVDEGMEGLVANLVKKGSGIATPKQLMAHIRARLHAKLNVHPFIVLNSEPTKHWVHTAIGNKDNQFGADGVTAYHSRNMWDFAQNKMIGRPDGFDKLREWYPSSWSNSIASIKSWQNETRDFSTKRYIVPIDTGADSRPWQTPIPIPNPNGPYPEDWERNPDGSWKYAYVPRSRPKASQMAEFRRHLEEAKAFLHDANNVNYTDKMAIICCWNEYGEGSILEPTVPYVPGLTPGQANDYLGNSLLINVRDVFLPDRDR